MSETIAHVQTLTSMNCGMDGCGIAFAIPNSLYRKANDDHDVWFYCPNGHRIHFLGKSDVEKARGELAATKERLEAARGLARRESERRQHAERRRAAAQGQVTKIKRRVGRGVCPCCNRTFADLGRHMAGQHPEFASES